MKMFSNDAWIGSEKKRKNFMASIYVYLCDRIMLDMHKHNFLLYFLIKTNSNAIDYSINYTINIVLIVIVILCNTICNNIDLILIIILKFAWISQSESSIMSEYKSAFHTCMSVFNISKVICNSHVMFVYVIIVQYC